MFADQGVSAAVVLRAREIRVHGKGPQETEASLSTPAPSTGLAAEQARVTCTHQARQGTTSKGNFHFGSPVSVKPGAVKAASRV